MELSKSELSDLKKTLPTSHQYDIKSALCHSKDYLEVKLLANIRSKEEVKNWRREYCEKSRTSWMTRSAPTVTGKRITFKLILGCIHNGRAKSIENSGKRNTNCPAQIIITISAISTKKKQYVRAVNPDPQKPCEIYLRLNHNHPIHASSTLRFRPVSDEVKNKLRELYHRGHTVATARKVVKIDLQSEHPDNYEELLTDRHVYPDYQACYYLFSKEFEKEYGPMNSRDYQFVVNQLVEYNEQSEIPSACWDVSELGVTIAICTPLMRRVHQMTPAAADVVFIDSSGTVDRDGYRIFILLTHNESGGVPLGVLITPSESVATVTIALRMLKELVGEDAFYGAKEGPSIFMTDDSTSERNSLGAVWPTSTLLLCHYHILQAVWRWLQQVKHLLKKDRVALYHSFKRIIYAKTELECCQQFESLRTGPLKKSKHLFEHISQCYWDRKEEWALCFRSGSLARGNYTNEYAEAAVRVLGDKVFERIKTFNLVQMTDFVMTRLEGYYKRKLLDVAHDRMTWSKLTHVKKAWLAPPPSIIDNIEHIGSNSYRIPSESGTGSYIVDEEMSLCECFEGNGGPLCKHQVWLSIYLDRPLIAARTVDVRRKMYTIATGETPATCWLAPLHTKHGDGSQEATECTVCELVCKEEPESEDELEVEDEMSWSFEQEDNNTDSWKVKGEEAIKDIEELLLASLVSEDITKALKVMKANLSEIRTPAALASALITFGNGVGN